jgi:hypothetical protein
VLDKNVEIGIQDIDNGHAAITESIKNATHSVIVLPNDLRRLARLHARNEGAVQVAQAAVNAANAAGAALQQAVTEACGDQGLRIPANSAADIDWQTGEVTITPTAS